MAWPKFGHVIYFLFWNILFPFLVRGEGGGLQDLIQIKGPCVPEFFLKKMHNDLLCAKEMRKMGVSFFSHETLK